MNPYDTCSICSQIPASAFASQKVGHEDGSALPIQFSQLIPETGSEDTELNWRFLTCPECQTRYQLESHHDYFVDGSEDTQELTRL